MSDKDLIEEVGRIENCGKQKFFMLKENYIIVGNHVMNYYYYYYYYYYSHWSSGQRV